MIAPIPPEPFNKKSLKSWLIKIVLPVGLIAVMTYFLLPTMLDSLQTCLHQVRCDW